MKKPCTTALAMLLCLGALVSCGTEGSTPAVTDDTAADNVVTTAVTEPEITSGNPADLDLGGLGQELQHKGFAQIGRGNVTVKGTPLLGGLDKLLIHTKKLLSWGTNFHSYCITD
jgi:hypothetical protein